MAKTEEFGSEYAANQIARQRSPLRKLIKSFYVSRVVRQVNGPTIDLGCGAGQILERLPPGSLGIEVNPHLVNYLAERGFRVLPAVASGASFDLSQIKKNEFKNLVLSHVLEHFENANQVLGALLRDCNQLGVETVIIVVPGANGYRSDATHKTFVNLDYLHQHALDECEGFRLTEHSYFPLNSKFVGELFIYHELMLIYKSKNLKNE